MGSFIEINLINLILSFSLSLSYSLSLSLFVSHNLSVSHPLSQALCLSLSISFSHSHSLSLSLTLFHPVFHSYDSSLSAIAVGKSTRRHPQTELMNVSFCRSVNISGFIYRNIKENVTYVFFLTSPAVFSMFCSSYLDDL